MEYLLSVYGEEMGNLIIVNKFLLPLLLPSAIKQGWEIGESALHNV